MAFEPPNLLPGAGDGVAFGFTKPDHRRVSDAVRFTERQYRNRPGSRGRYPVGSGGGLVDILIGYTGGSGIGERTTDGSGFPAPGSASVTLLLCDGTNFYVAATAVTGGGGSGYTDGTGYTMTFSGGTALAQATGTFDVVSGSVTNLKITSGGKYLHTGSAPSVSFTGAGSGTGASATVTIGQSVTCLNFSGATIAADVYITIGHSADGLYRVLSEDCA